MEHTDSSTSISSFASLAKSIKSKKEESFYFRNFDFEFLPTKASTIDVQVLKYEGKLDLCLYTSLGRVKEVGEISAIQYTAGKLAREIKAKTLICGLEPAIDEETRFFTDAELGPLSI